MKNGLFPQTQKITKHTHSVSLCCPLLPWFSELMAQRHSFPRRATYVCTVLLRRSWLRPYGYYLQYKYVVIVVLCGAEKEETLTSCFSSLYPMSLCQICLEQYHCKYESGHPYQTCFRKGQKCCTIIQGSAFRFLQMQGNSGILF